MFLLYTRIRITFDLPSEVHDSVEKRVWLVASDIRMFSIGTIHISTAQSETVFIYIVHIVRLLIFHKLKYVSSLHTKTSITLSKSNFFQLDLQLYESSHCYCLQSHPCNFLLNP